MDYIVLFDPEASRLRQGRSIASADLFPETSKQKIMKFIFNNN